MRSQGWTPRSSGAVAGRQFRQQRTPRFMAWGFSMERVTRIELALSAWEAAIF